MKVWTDADAHCLNLNSHLVSIYNNAENEFVKSLAEHSNNLVWIGIFSYNLDLSRLQWTDGSSVNFTNWYTDPSPGSKYKKRKRRADNSFCVSYDTTSALWLNKSCLNEYPFACKRKGKLD